MNPNHTFLWGGWLVVSTVILFLIILFTAEPKSVRVPATVIESCIGRELESRKSYHLIPNEILTYCLEKNQHL